MNPEIQRKSSIAPDGSRAKIRIADVSGKFSKARKYVFALLVAIYLTLPFIQIGGHPAILLDIPRRQFFFFGLTFNAQDFYLSFFIISGAAFFLFYITALFGRIWCGWACPQTVFLEGVFRTIERWIEGPKSEQLLLFRSAWNFNRISKLLAKHALFIGVCLLISHAFISYFVPLADLRNYVLGSPKEHWPAFVWMAAISVGIYINFAWFREQLCLIVCPYGRIQSALTDEDTLVIGYDTTRGEPRGKKNQTDRGDCIDCRRFVDVCPTGIDIRNGLQLECVGCANCIDACDEIMDKVGQKHGLVRYDSLNGFKGKPLRLLRPRIYLYTFLMLVGASVASYSFYNRKPFEANVLRPVGLPYEFAAGVIRNRYTLHLVNKSSQTVRFDLNPVLMEGIHYIVPVQTLELAALENKTIPVFVEIQESQFHSDMKAEMTVRQYPSGETLQAVLPILGPNSKK